MLELLSFYALAFVVVFFASFALSMAGEHTLPRGQSLEIFTLAQFALLGHLAANLWTHHSGICLLTSGLFYFLARILIRKMALKLKITDPLMIALYLMVLSTQYFMITAFPGLDGHMTVGVFGSVVTSGYYESLIMIAIFIVCILHLLKKRRQYLKHSIEKSLLNAQCHHPMQEVMIALILITSLFGLGILYTLSFLLIPWVLIGHLFSNQKKTLIIITLTSIIASLSGLYISIAFENISTTPGQVLLLIIFCALFYLKTDKIDSLTKSK